MEQLHDIVRVYIISDSLTLIAVWSLSQVIASLERCSTKQIKEICLEVTKIEIQPVTVN